MASAKDKKRPYLKLISVLAAVILWLYVTNIADDKLNNDFIPAEIKYINVAANFTLVAPEQVGVKVWGGQRIQTDKIRVLVDLQGLGAGKHVCPVQLQPIEGALLTQVKPDEVEIELIPQVKQQLPIEVELLKEPAVDFKVVDMLVTPDFSLMQGDAEALAQVKKLVVELDLSQSKNGVVKKVLPVIPKDADNQPVKADLKLLPGEAEVVAVVEAPKVTKAVPVKYNLSGQPPADYILGSVSMEPAQVNVTATKSVLANIDQVMLKPIDISGYTSGITTFTEAEPLPGVLIYPKYVKVTVEMLRAAAPDPADNLSTEDSKTSEKNEYPGEQPSGEEKPNEKTPSAETGGPVEDKPRVNLPLLEP